MIADVGPPAAVRIGQKIRVYYVKDGTIRASESQDLSSWTDLGQMVGATPFGVPGRAFARAANTPAGRLRHDLYFTVNTGNMPLPTPAASRRPGTGSFRDHVYADHRSQTGHARPHHDAVRRRRAPLVD